MHWILTVSDSFSLAQVIQRSQWLLHPPFGVSRSQENLTRVERLSTRHTITLTISQVPAGLILRTNERLTGRETEEVSHKTWRMLRLGEDLQPFLETAKHTPGLKSVFRCGGLLLRGTTFFEDVVKAIILTQEAEQWHAQRISWIVDRFGDPLPSNPTLHAFPIPYQLLWGRQPLGEMLGPALADSLVKTAEAFCMQADQIDALIQADLSLDTLEANLKELLGLNDEVMGLMMLSLGRYDYIPVDQCAQQRVSQYWHDGGSVRPEDVRAAFAPLQPWGGLGYWLWDWREAGNPVESELGNDGKLENRCRAS